MGYTIIETMIAISIFLVVVMIGMGALLNANLVHKKTEDMRSIMDNLSFILEDMSRNLRTGYKYHCNMDASGPASEEQQNCESGKSLFFEISTGGDGVGDQWGYKIDPLKNIISKSVNGGTEWVQLNADEIEIEGSSSSFTVLGADDEEQPFVTIRLVGNIVIPNKDVVTPFSLQTSVSQRTPDPDPDEEP